MSRDAGHDDPESQGRLDAAEGGDALTSLLNEVGEVARSEDAEAASFPGADVPALSAETRDRLVERILATRAGAEQGSVALIADARSSRLRRTAARPAIIAAVAGSVAAAAAFAFWIRSDAGSLALPTYAISAEGGESDVRGAPEAARNDAAVAPLQRLRRRSELVVSLRPETSVTGPVAARAFVVWGDAIVEAPALFRAAPSGAVQLVLKGADLVGKRRGPGRLRVVVGRPRALESFDPQRMLADDAGLGWRTLTVPVLFEAD